MDTEFDVIVLGGGPAGSSASAFLSKAGKKVLLLDRAKFPRDKTCGDGISGRSVGVLRDLGILDEFKKVEHELMYGVTFSSPNSRLVPVSSKGKGPDPNASPGFVCRREVFDNVVFQNAKKLATKTIEGFFATELIMDDGKVVGVKGKVDGKDVEYRAKVLVGADGAAGISARQLNSVNTDESHQCAGLRCYYENVEGMGDKIELHFVKEAIPGYFWIFPLPNKKANVGIGMLVKDMKAKKINLQKVMLEIIENNPMFKERFAKSKRITDIKSWMLPLATKRTKIAGNGYVLVGDAASLIDPFTGEGIGNGLTSGKIAATVISEAIASGDFSEKKLSDYPKRLFDLIGGEVSSNYKMQKLSSHPFLLNLIIGKAERSKYVQEIISDALINPDKHDKLTDPIFILKALFS